MSGDTKKGGFLSGFVEAAKHELFEDDAAAAAPAHEAAQPTAAPVADVAPLASLPDAPGAVDPTALKVVKANVYTDVDGHPSRFVKFLKMLEALGTADAALKALQVADESITATGVLEDISSHLDLLAACNKSATAEFDAASRDRLGGRDKEIAALQAANQTAASEIERHQKETSDRNGQIAKLQQARAQDEGKITAARQREAAAEAAVRTELLNMQKLFKTKG